MAELMQCFFFPLFFSFGVPGVGGGDVESNTCRFTHKSEERKKEHKKTQQLDGLQYLRTVNVSLAPPKLSSLAKFSTDEFESLQQCARQCHYALECSLCWDDEILLYISLPRLPFFLLLLFARTPSITRR